MHGKKAKRFYAQTAVSEVEGGFAVLLDGRTLSTPRGTPLILQSAALARAIAGEWEAQEEEINPRTMPMTGLANAAVDRIGPEREAMIERLRGYAETDLLCYRAEEPEDLIRRQQRHWQPLLDWAEEAHGIHLTVTSGVVPVAQPGSAREALSAVLEGCDDFEVTALVGLAAATGSLIIAMALAAGRIDAAEAFSLAFLDENFQSERWGMDAEALARLRAIEGDIQAAARLLDLHRAR